jgi:hypothetical protein
MQALGYSRLRAALGLHSDYNPSGAGASPTPVMHCAISADANLSAQPSNKTKLRVDASATAVKNRPCVCAALSL